MLIAGGGIAGVEAALALRDLAGDRAEIDLRDPRRELVFRPFAIGEPYGTAGVFRCDLRQVAERCGASFEADAVVSVDTGRRLATTRDGERLSYDYLVIASGARMLAAVPGAATFWGVAGEGEVGDTIADLRAGSLRRLVFTMPGGPGWALPLYELALMAMSEVEKASHRTRIAVVTPEAVPLELFGGRVGEQMSSLLEDRGIEVVSGAHPVEFENGRLGIAPGEEIEADAAIGLPRLEGRRIAGVPHDAEGFVSVDEHGRAIGLERVFAAGDVTAFPVKQGGVATQQADVVAEAIAAEVGAEVEPRAFDPILRGVLWTGRDPRCLYGRPAKGHGEISSLGERPQPPSQAGKAIGRHLTAFVDSLAGDRGQAAPAGSPFAP